MESCFEVICAIIGWAIIIAIALAIAPYIFPILLIIIIVVIISFIKELLKELNSSKEENNTNSNNDIKLPEEILVEDEFDSELEDIDPETYKSIFKEEKPAKKNSDPEDQEK